MFMIATPPITMQTLTTATAIAVAAMAPLMRRLSRRSTGLPLSEAPAIPPAPTKPLSAG
ncbi:MAG: hypothetical protein Q8N47_27120 [Bryobacterales bacterium]|nr:hypothetical protein [Bryobacterales bacterium]